MYRSLFYGLLAAICISINATAQENDYRANLIPPSPDASALGKYAESAIGLFAGTLPLSIPIYTVKDGGLQIPVYLSYNASGNKIEEAASFAGLGFTLNAGGAIMRSVRNLPDDYPVKGFLDYSISYGQDYLKNNPNRYTQWKEIAAGCADAEPDAYFFNFNGYTGSFTFNSNGNVVIHSQNDWKTQVLKTDINNPKKITGWKFTCDNGIVYTFNAAEQTTLINDGIDCHAGIVYNSAWYLSSITTPNAGRTVNFTYESYSMNFDVNHSVTQRIFCYPNPADCQPTASAPSANFTKMSYAGQRIKTITTSDKATTVVFNYITTRTDEPGTNLKQLDEVVVYNKDNVLFRKFNFTYDYSTGRLSLRSMKKTGTDELPYKFDYNGIIIPPRIANGNTPASYGQDHWGYYNGIGDNTTLLPPTSKVTAPSNLSISYPGGNRSVDEWRATAGMLVRVTYPAGGFDEYEYAGNEYGFIGWNTVESLGQYESIVGTTDIVLHADAKGTDTPSNSNTSSSNFVISNQDNDFVYMKIALEGQLAPIGIAHVEISSGGIVYFSKDFLASPKTVKSNESTYLPKGKTYTIKAEATGREVETNLFIDYYSFASIKLSFDSRTVTNVPIKKKTTGGLRIQKVTSYADKDRSNPSIRQYTYEFSDKNNSSGVLTEEPKYDITNLKYFTGGESACSYDLRISQNKAILGYGPHVLYGKVTELLGNNGENGKTEYTFLTPLSPPAHSFDQPPFQAATSNNSYAQGGILNGQSSYKRESDKSFKLVSEELQGKFFFADPSFDGLKISFDGGANTPTKFHAGFYPIVFGIWQTTQVTRKDYASNGTTWIETKEEFLYTRQFLKSKKKYFGSNTSNYDFTEYYYPRDFVNPTPAIQAMISKNSVSAPLEIVKKKVTADATLYTGGLLKKYAIDASSRVFPATEHALQLAQPSSSYLYSYSAAAGVADARYVTLNTMENYDAKENLVQLTGKNGITSSFIWDKHNDDVLVKAVGVGSDAIAWSSFENTTPSYFGGQWTLTGSYVTSDYATGKQCYKGKIDLKTGGFNTQDYVVSFWMKGGPIYIGNIGLPETANWTFYEKTIAVNGSPKTPSTIQIDASSGLIDELRVFPVGAQLTTYCYDQLNGANTVTDEKSKPTFFEFDNLGRVHLIKDHNKDIVKRINHDYDVLIPLGYTLSATQTGDFTYLFKVEGGSSNYTYEFDFDDLTKPTTTTATSLSHTFNPLTLNYNVTVRVKNTVNTLATLSKVVTATKKGENNAPCYELQFVSIKQASKQSPNVTVSAPPITGAAYFWSIQNEDGKTPISSEEQTANFVLYSGESEITLTISTAGKACSISRTILAD